MASEITDSMLKFVDDLKIPVFTGILPASEESAHQLNFQRERDMVVSNRCLVWFCAMVCGTLVGTGWTTPDSAFAQKSPEELLPAETVLYVHSRGLIETREALKETAAYQAVYGSGLSKIIERLFTALGKSDHGAELSAAIEHVGENGFSLAIAVDPPQPGPLALWGTIVVPEAGEGVDLLATLFEALKDEKFKVHDTRIQGREVKYINVPDAPADFGWWKEDDHLVIAFGMNSIASAIAVASEKRDNLSESELFKTYQEFDGEFVVADVAWFDFKSLREMFADVPIPVQRETDPVPLKDIIETLGLQTLNHIASVSGYRDEALWSELIVEAPGERTGLLSLIDQPTFKIDDLPAIPLNQIGVSVSSFDWGPGYETILEIVREIAALSSDADVEKIDNGLKQFKKDFGFSPDQFFSSLGSLNCVYADRGQGILGLGSVALIQTKDADQLVECIEKIFALVEKESKQSHRKNLKLQKTVHDDYVHFRAQFTQLPFFQPTISVDEDWVIIGLVPQSVQAQRMRMNGELLSWSLETDLETAMALLPDEITSLTVFDPAAGYRELVSLAPVFLGLMELGLREQGQLGPDQSLPIDAGDFPPAEAVTEPLFFNVGVSTVDESGLQIYSRRSLPILPILGGKESVRESGTETSHAQKAGKENVGMTRFVIVP
ncbi:MAG TPA: hypothetical protein VNQ76_19430 [Planctomicrobium sp.]|nr:hypothetical protein [Planctomicrobium sp.]